ncbi:Putative secreted protein [Sphingopyxis fribergensis]|uniref:Putative secreted protein n=2 Tax=Sphingopyxis fribergensis TaxID=1515612 RepID=A0A0A7PKE2_9SPHN|nr:Putative secreted protein [Sphingopyxis fribergensis]
MLTMMMAFALVASGTPPTAAAAAAAERRPPLDRPASTMTGTEIKAYNVGLAPTHPDFIKCRKIEEIGSLVKKARVCRTNEQWKQAWAQGNQNARDTAEVMTRAPVNHSN